MACPAGGPDSPGSTQYGLPSTTPLFFAGENPFPLAENPFLQLDPVTDSLSSAPLRLLLHRLGESASTANP